MRLEDQEEEVAEEKDVEEEPDSTGREDEEMKKNIGEVLNEERKLNFAEVSKEDENDTKGSNIPLI